MNFLHSELNGFHLYDDLCISLQLEIKNFASVKSYFSVKL